MKKPTKAKLLIGDTSKSIEVMFNPSEYKITKSQRYDTTAGPTAASGTATPATEPTYVGDESSVLSVELFFDTSREGKDVRKETMEIVKLLDRDPKAKAPTHVTFVWGSLKFKGYIQKIDQSFTMFMSSGAPVRARLNVDIISKQSSAEQYQSVMDPIDMTSSFLLRAGVQLCLIAAQELADAVKWRKIAKVNKIENPAKLPEGQSIQIPRS